MRLLVVRDRRSLAVVTRRGLARPRPVVDAACDAMERTEAPERDGRNAPVLAMTGRILTGLDGVQRPDVTNAAAPVLTLPAYDGPRDVDVGANGYPSPPIAVEELRARLDFSPTEVAASASALCHADQVVGRTLGMERARDDDVGQCDTMVHATVHRSRTAMDTGHDRPRMQTVHAIESAAEDRGVRLVVETLGVVRVVGDAGRLRQALLILLDNALTYTPDNGSITVSVARQGGHAWLRVRDSGPGIAPEDLPHLFERFYRADKARGSVGSGLGLSIGRWIAEAHGGHITAANALGRVALFTVTLPLASP